jgi:ribonuclease J
MMTTRLIAPGDDPFNPEADALYFLALGGAGEIGMNLSLYGHAGAWLMVDLGISFPDETMPGVEVIMPDHQFIAERREQLAGLVLTHAHEDHLGAVQYLWPDLKCPVYATPFTAAVLRAKLHERGLAGKIPVHEIPMGGSFKVGPFDLEFVTVTHSILEPNALAIRTPVGTVVHTGDWKLDPQPLIGTTADEARLRAIGDEGVLALVCDSTNALTPGWTGSESGVRDALIAEFKKHDQRIAVTCFATNVARLESIAVAAAEAGRHAALVGRSLWRIHEAAKATGYLKDIPAFLSEYDAGFLPPDKVVLACTGSQGEPRSALARIAAGDHPQIVLDKGDVVIFSSREIPGNERAIARVQNRLAERGIGVITADDVPVHVSGHPARDEMAQMYQWVRPRISVPVHGDARRQLAHAELAAACQTPQSVVPGNGDLIRLAPGDPKVVAGVPSGRLALDGKRLINMATDTLRSRNRLINSGAVVATLVVGGRGDILAPPQIAVMGLLEGVDADRDLLLDFADIAREAVGNMPKAQRLEDGLVREAVRLALRRAASSRFGKKPQTEVHLIRLD